MSDRLAYYLIRLFAPYERARARHVKRQYERGKFRRPYAGDPRDIGAGAVTTRRKDDAA